MKKHRTEMDKPSDLRRRAEERLKDEKKDAEAPLPAFEHQKSLHELQVYQIELEMQNEELRRANEAIEEGYRKYADLYDLAPVGYFTMDDRSVIREANLIGSRLLGLERSKLMGRHFRQFVLAESLPVFDAFLKKAFTAQERVFCEVAVQLKGRERFTVLVEGTLREAENDRQAVCRIVLVDITERKKTEKSLVESEYRHKELFENMSSCVAIYEAVAEGDDFLFKDFNRSAEKAERLQRGDIIGKSVLAVFPGVREMGLFDVFRRVWRTGKSEHYPACFYKDDRIEGWKENYVYKLPSGEIVAIYDDVTERKRKEEQRALSLRVMDILNSASDRRDLVCDILMLIKAWTGIEAVGIRLRDGDDYPYYKVNGFPDRFVEAENYLCARDEQGKIICDSLGNPCLECMCGNVLAGRTDPSRPFFTERGSFWTNDSTKLLASTTENDSQARTRNRCNSEGYESVALVPLRYGGETIGLLQFNDRRPNRFDLEFIEFFEGIGLSLGIATARRKSLEALRESEGKFRTAFDNANVGMCLVDLNGVFMQVNDKLCAMLGCSREELEGSAIDDVTHPDDSAITTKFIREALAGKSESAVYEKHYIHKDGRIINGQVSISLLRDRAGNPLYFISHVQDITERTTIQEKLRASEELFRLLIENTHDIIYMLNAEGAFTFVSNSWTVLLGHPTGQVVGKSFREFVHSDDIAACQAFLEKVIKTGQRQSGIEYRVRHTDGSWRWHSSSGVPVRDAAGGVVGYEGIARDVTEKEQAEEALRSSLAEKTALLQEVHHRVKNNLQIVASLANLQRQYITDTKAIDALSDMRDRIYSMALIHENIYREANFAAVAMDTYIANRVKELLRDFMRPNQKISLTTSLDPVMLSIDKAIPCGLIISEVITNALKHAFAERSEGSLHVEMKKKSDGMCDLSVTDDGPGIPESIDIHNTETFGFRLIELLVRQLHGAFEVEGRKGTALRMRFPM